MNGAEAICHILEDEGVKYIFGVPGSTEIPLLDALTQTAEIKYISAVHESVSMGMADGYARASGKAGVVLVHTAPGTSYVIGNLYNAYNANTPVVVIAGKQDSRMARCDPFLDAELLPMVSEFTKGCWNVTHAHDIMPSLRNAFKEAATSPMGPVFVAIPRDLQSEVVDPVYSVGRARQISAGVRPDKEHLEKAAQLLVEAEQPAILAGHQVADADAMRELIEVAELLGAPVFITAQVPKLIFPTDHPLYFSRVPPIGFSLPGLEGHTDVLLAIGSNLFKQLFYVGGYLISPEIKTIQVDLDPRGLSKDCSVDVSILSNPKIALAELIGEIKKMISDSHRERNQRRLKKMKGLHDKLMAGRQADFRKERNTVPMKPSRAITEIAEALPRGTIVVDEAVMLTSYVECCMHFAEQGSYFSSNACLGWGLPASLGVSLASSYPVVAMVGDGSAIFGIQSLWTAAKYQIPVTIVVLNNRGYAAIKWGFSMLPDRVSKQGDDLGYDLGGVDFTKLAEAFGVEGQRIEDPSKIKPIVQKAIKADKPVLIDLIVDPRDVGYGLPGLP